MTAKTDSETLDEALEIFHTAEKGSAEHKRAFAMMMYLGQKLYADTFRLIGDLFCEGKGPFRWVALSGDPQDIYETDRVIKELFPEDKALINWLDMAAERVEFQGLPSHFLPLRLSSKAKG